MATTVCELMTHPPLVVRGEASIRDALNLLLNDSAPQLDVVDGEGRLLGSVPDYELLKAQMSGDDGRAVISVMSSAAARLDARMTVEFAAALFRDGRYRRLPVVDDGQVVGQIDRRDIMRRIYALATPDQSPGDAGSTGNRNQAELPAHNPRYTTLPPSRREAAIGR